MPNFVVVDGRRALLSSNEPLSQLFNEGGTRYRPTANKVIADVLRTAVKTRHLKETKPPGGGLVGWVVLDPLCCPSPQADAQIAWQNSPASNFAQDVQGNFGLIPVISSLPCHHYQSRYLKFFNTFLYALAKSGTRGFL